MQWGYGAMSDLAPALAWATLIVFLSGFIAPLAYPVGNRWGRRAALIWFVAVYAIAALVITALVVLGASSGQLERFTATYGTTPLAEMTVFGCLWLIITGFPTLRSITDRER